MEKPHRFTLVHKITKNSKPFISYRSEPIIDDISAYVEVSPGISEKQIVYDVYEDIRYKAKIRLYNYIYGIKKYKHVYANTEIGKTIPILQF